MVPLRPHANVLAASAKDAASGRPDPPINYGEESCKHSGRNQGPMRKNPRTHGTPSLHQGPSQLAVDAPQFLGQLHLLVFFLRVKQQQPHLSVLFGAESMRAVSK